MERQAFTKQRYLRSIGTYESHPFAARHISGSAEGELTALEHEMLDMPPLYRSPAGVVMPRSKGLLAYDVLIQSGELPPVRAMSVSEAGLKVIPEREWSDIIDDPNRTPPRDYFDHEVDQNGYGSCAGEGAANGGSTRIAQDGQEKVCLNGYFNYHHSSGGVDRGSSLSENISVMQKHGCCTVDVRPRSHGWRAKPTDAEYEDAAKHKLMPDGIVRARNKAEMATLVLKGFSVYFGYPGHAILCVDIVSTSRLLYQNSWGKDWGNNGRGTLAFSSIQWGYGAFAFVSMGDKP
jgi:hypothetical protein